MPFMAYKKLEKVVVIMTMNISIKKVNGKLEFLSNNYKKACYDFKFSSLCGKKSTAGKARKQKEMIEKSFVDIGMISYKYNDLIEKLAKIRINAEKKAYNRYKCNKKAIETEKAEKAQKKAEKMAQKALAMKIDKYTGKFQCYLDYRVKGLHKQTALK